MREISTLAMIKIVLGFLQAIAKAFLVIVSLAIVFMLCLVWFKFFQEGGRIPLDAVDATIIISGETLPEHMVENISAVLNESSFTAALVLSGFSFLMVFTLLPFYLVQQFLANLAPEKWFAEENTKHLKLLAFYFIVIAVLELVGYIAASYLLDETSVKLSAEPGYFLTGLGVLLLSYMYQQGVKLRQEAEMTV